MTDHGHPPWPSRRSPHTLGIEVPGEMAALALIERLAPLHCELAPADRGCCRVTVELRPRPGHRVVERVLDIVTHWARRQGIKTALLDFDSSELVIGASHRASARPSHRVAT